MDEAKWVLAVFACALLVRAVFLWQNPAFNDGVFSVQGTPYSDAREASSSRGRSSQGLVNKMMGRGIRAVTS